MTSQNFCNLKIGDKFHTGKAKGLGAQSGVTYWLEYQKTSPTKAVCINQVGYGNTRQIGLFKSFGPYALTWSLE